MPSVVKSLALLLLAAATAPEAASARDRAPIEYATRSARPEALEPARPQVAVATASPARRPAAAAMDQPDILYGYGHAFQRSGRAPLDLRGTLRGPADPASLADDAFDEIAPTVAPPVTSGAEPDRPEEAPSPADVETPPAGGGYFVQVGAFANPANAERARAALQDVGSVTIDQRPGASVTLHRVRLGQWPTRAAAELACDMIVERGFAGAVVSESR
ncbi:MAG: SPOR domain-containing protein [Hyphomonadaceae bacterium]|nr:MAG: hypothetical protein FD160_110 [Caulobacteraceae bacterium]MBT9445123.1 SPOR domain-containing protein [Hyphomonadaceae bacterium]TPW08447.1 MAG: hypothetical protein FD124_411 [Alphaproteobacteria bacterium]